jgi:Fe-S-cluster containining protein
MDMDIALIDLVFPERMSDDGREFCEVHGINNETIESLFLNAIDLNNGFVKIFHRCNKLQDDGQCSIYLTRPKICRDFDCSKRTDCACKGTGKWI